jgi:4-amino-4-deoxy-L-arabinose transferase-like glycosyltransferase
MIVSAGWWVAIVALWPAGSRPYIGGSQTNSILELTLGYNGFGRLTGNETGSVGGGGPGGGGWGATGITRMLGSEVGGQVAWLLPAAVILLGAGLWFTRRAPRTDRVRAGLVLWGVWLAVTALTFSFMAGIFHAYYTVALAPAIGALVAIGATVLWRRRDSYPATLTLAAAVSFTAAFGFVLLTRTPDYLPLLKWVVGLLGFTSAFLLVAVAHLPRAVATVVAGTALVSALAAPAAYSVTTAATPHTGSIPTAGPSSAGGSGAPGGFGQPFGGGFGLLEGSRSPAAVTALLRRDAETYSWAAAAVGSNTAAGYQLASQQPVMAIGGFNGSDPSPTLAQFKRYVADGRIHYFIGSGGGGGRMSPGGGTSSAIASWVESMSPSRTVAGVTLYDLSGGVR